MRVIFVGFSFAQNNGKKGNRQKIRVAVLLCDMLMSVQVVPEICEFGGCYSKLKASNHAHYANID